MSELRIFYKEKEKIRIARSLDILKELDKKDIIWIDLVDVKEEVENELEQFLKIYIQEDEEIPSTACCPNSMNSGSASLPYRIRSVCAKVYAVASVSAPPKALDETRKARSAPRAKASRSVSAA